MAANSWLLTILLHLLLLNILDVQTIDSGYDLNGCTFDMAKLIGVLDCNQSIKGNQLPKPYARPRRRSFVGQRTLFYSNSSATTQFELLILAGNVHLNPGPKYRGSSTRPLCAACTKALRKDHNGVQCSSCRERFHIKCSRMSSQELRLYRTDSQFTWICTTCSLPQFSESFFNDSLDLSANSSILSNITESNEEPTSWYSKHVKGYYKNNLSIAYLNVNSIFSKADEVIGLLESCSFDILFIAESKIDSTVPNSLIAHPMYRIIRRDRKKGGGGILVYVRSNISAYRRKKFEPNGVESICLDVKGCGNTWFLVCGCYRSEKICSATDFISACEIAAEQMLAKRKEIIFTGDLNMDMNLNSDRDREPHRALSNFCEQFCLTNVITKPTRVTTRSKSLIDVILTSHPDRFACYGNLNLGLSDHDLVYIVRKQKLPRPKSRSIEYRSLANLNTEEFISDLNDIPWDTAYTFDNVDDVWCHWLSLFKQITDIHAPFKRTRLRFKQLPWINLPIQKEMRHRNRLYKKFRRVPSDANWELYRIQRNKVSTMKRNSVKAFCSQAAADASLGAVGQFWKKMKPLLPSNKSITTQSITLIDDGGVVSDPSVTFNNYFSKPAIDEHVIGQKIEDFASHPSVAMIAGKRHDLDFAFEHVTESYVADLISNLDGNKSSGPDGFPPKILKLAAPALAAPITSLFNYCIDRSKWPSQWKTSNVTPIHKKAEETCKENYRPVSILSTIPKLFEKIKYDQLYRAFSPLFSNNMSGFLRGHSCCTALLKMTDDWRALLDQKMIVGVAAIDLSKAFDSICHNLLLAKLKAYGLRNSALRLLESYLSDRYQRVKCNGRFSTWLPVKCGVPQGSLLGPLLFNIFVNDVNDCVSASSLRLYADDTTQYSASINPVTLEININSDISRLNDWFAQNCLRINGKKTQAMILGNSNEHDFELLVGSEQIEIRPILKILGVTLDNKLTYQAHITEMLKKFFAKVAALRRIKKLIPPHTMVSLYKTYVLPHLEYCSPILLGISTTLKKKLENCNYYAIRTLLNLGNTVTYESCLTLADMEFLERRRTLQSISLFFKAHRLQGPAYISSFFSPRTCAYNLRSSGLNVSQPSYSSCYLHNSFSYIISHIWNNLPSSTKMSSTITELRSRLNDATLTGCKCNKCLANC